MIRYLKNERGSSVIPFTALFAMAMVILMMLLMIWVSAEISFIGIRNAVKNELTNVSICISEDTYKVMREGNLNAYYNTLTSDSSYQNELQQMVWNHTGTKVYEPYIVNLTTDEVSELSVYDPHPTEIGKVIVAK